MKADTKLVAHRMSESDFPPDTWRYSLQLKGRKAMLPIKPVYMRRLESFYWFCESENEVDDVTSLARPTPHIEVIKRWARETLHKRYSVIAQARACESAGQQRLF
jgi:hypothetical protein